MPAEEKVLCFKRELFEELGAFQGLSLDVEKYLPVLTSSENLTYKYRSQAENDPHYKQLIPYVLIVCGDRLLRYQRGKGGQETRLRGLWSVGIGGHISEEDSDLFTKNLGYREGMRREVEEEVDLKEVSESVVAVINDDSTEVGRVHFGVVHVMQVENEDVAGRRSGIVSPEFIAVADAVKDASNYESWSRFCLENLTVLLAKATASRIAAPHGT